MKKLFLILIQFLFFVNTFAQTKKINVYAFVAEECPISIYMTDALKNISIKYAAQANFTLVFPLQTSTAKTATAFKSKNKLSLFTINVDKKQSLTKKLGAIVTPEVIVTDSTNAILYKGRINDAYLEPGKQRHSFSNNDLEKALALITTSKEVPKPWRSAVGCYITIKK